MKKRRTKEIKQQAKMALQGHLGTVILGLLAVYGLNMLGTILSTTLFSGTSVLDLVLSEVFLLVVSLIVGIITAGFGYMLLNISRGKEFSLGDLGYFFPKSARQSHHCRICAGTDPGDHSHSLLLCKLYHRSGTNSGGTASVVFYYIRTSGSQHFAEFPDFHSVCHDLFSDGR